MPGTMLNTAVSKDKHVLNTAVSRDRHDAERQPAGTNRMLNTADRRNGNELTAGTGTTLTTADSSDEPMAHQHL